MVNGEPFRLFSDEPHIFDYLRFWKSAAVQEVLRGVVGRSVRAAKLLFKDLFQAVFKDVFQNVSSVDLRV